MKRTAFTLLELLLVLAIIATICGLGITSYQRQYARSQFKSGLVQIQVDLHKTRLLAMQSGEAYLFRYVPGTSVYEIAPLKTLQEVLYRIYGEAESSNDDALGGSLSFTSANLNPLASASVSDDLFSSENIGADIAAKSRELRESKQEVFGIGSNSLGGSLDVVKNENLGDASFFSSEITNGRADAFSGAAFGAEESLALAGSSDPSAVSINFRELNAHEKSLAKDNSIAWRVNDDGVIVRKQAAGDVVFTMLRVSRSTPSNLRTHRPKGSTSVGESGVSDEYDLISSEKALGGSLTSIPDVTENGEGLGGGLNEIAGETSLTNEFGSFSEEKQFVSFWSEPIIFYPNGKTSSAVFGLESTGDFSFFSEIAIRGMTGVARISSISAVPPDVNSGSSVLTREQMFRLSNPMSDVVTSPNAGIATSGSLGGVTNELSPDVASDALTSSGESNDLNVPSDNLLLEEQFPSVNYGTGRRSGYNFNESVSSSSNDVPLGVSLGQGASSTLNASMGADPLNGTTPD